MKQKFVDDLIVRLLDVPLFCLKSPDRSCVVEIGTWGLTIFQLDAIDLV